MYSYIRLTAACLIATTYLAAAPSVLQFDTLLQGRTPKQAFEQEVIHHKSPVLVKFFLPGCPPCVRMKSILHKIAQELPHIRVLAVNGSLYPQLTQQYAVSRFPTCIYFSQGQQKGRTEGAMSAAEIRAKITQYFN